MKFPVAITEDQAKAVLRHIHGKRLSVEERVRVLAVARLLEQALSTIKSEAA